MTVRPDCVVGGVAKEQVAGGFGGEGLERKGSTCVGTTVEQVLNNCGPVAILVNIPIASPQSADNCIGQRMPACIVGHAQIASYSTGVQAHLQWIGVGCKPEASSC